jgi:hypothetical protein
MHTEVDVASVEESRKRTTRNKFYPAHLVGDV